VNPIFWRLHGWVDDCIRVWFSAHEQSHPGQVKPKQVRGIPWFEPGPWILKADPFDWPGADHPHEHGGHHGDDEVTTLERVMAILKEIDGRPEPGDVTAAAAPTPHAAAFARLSGFARFSEVVSEP
jgi:hypothetical protein